MFEPLSRRDLVPLAVLSHLTVNWSELLAATKVLICLSFSFSLSVCVCDCFCLSLTYVQSLAEDFTHAMELTKEKRGDLKLDGPCRRLVPLLSIPEKFRENYRESKRIHLCTAGTTQDLRDVHLRYGREHQGLRGAVGQQQALR